MSTRTLRSHTASGTTTQTLPNQPSSHTPDPETLPSQGLKNAETPVRLYSDVAASRAASPMGENYRDPIKDTETRASDAIKPVTDANDNTSSESEDGNSPWTTVKRGRARSLDSIKESIKNKKLIYLKPDALTKEQKQQVEQRQAKITMESDTEKEPGPSRKKGKATDPREWGNAGIDLEELDPETQAALIDAYK